MKQQAKELLTHKGHDVRIVTYGTAERTHNVALECYDCDEVIIDYDIHDILDNPCQCESGDMDNPLNRDEQNCKDCCDGYHCTYGCGTCFCPCHD